MDGPTPATPARGPSAALHPPPPAAPPNAAAPPDPPQWIQLLPAGPAVVGRDGRAWSLDDPLAVIRATSLPLAVTYDHAGFFGREAPAAGWIEQLEVRNGAVWGRVEWTENGRSAVQGKAYRFVSPEFVHDPDPPRRIAALLGAGLTNGPNLDLAAVASRRRPPAHARVNNKEKQPMTPAVRAALGLAENAGENEALAAVEALRNERDQARTAAANAARQPDLAAYVPRADYDAACARLEKTQTALAQQRADAREAAVEKAVAAALENGKIVPATADYHRAQCRLDGGLERFRAFCAAAPEIAPATAAAASANPPAAGADADPDPDARKIFNALGVSPDEARKYAARAAAAA